MTIYNSLHNHPCPIDKDFCTYFILFEISKQINKIKWYEKEKLKKEREKIKDNSIRTENSMVLV